MRNLPSLVDVLERGDIHDTPPSYMDINKPPPSYKEIIKDFENQHLQPTTVEDFQGGIYESQMAKSMKNMLVNYAKQKITSKTKFAERLHINNLQNVPIYMCNIKKHAPYIK